MELWTADEAAAALGVKRSTLYTYVSRGWLTSVSGTDGRSRRYLAEEVRAVRARTEASQGHRAVAATALHWGQPVIDTAVSTVSPSGPSYRGVPVADLLDADFEEVCALLWGQAMPSLPTPLGHGTGALHGRWLGAVAQLAADDPVSLLRTTRLELRRASACLAEMTGALGDGRAPGVGARVCEALGRPDAGRAVARTLVLTAEHGLTPSTFAVRVAASAGSNLFFAVSAGIATHAGSRHGRASASLRAAYEAVAAAPAYRAEAVLAEVLGRGEVGGFGHRLYADGDPREAWLWAEAERGGEGLTALVALRGAAASLGLPPPNLDFGLLALEVGWGLPAGTGAAPFGIGRVAGWTAHALEASEGPVVRPRARYTGRGQGA
jgi:citrate synthase